VDATSVSPQGEVAQVSQVVLSFDEAATAAQGTGRWLNDRRWVFDFEADLPPGVACSIQLKPGIKSASGALLTIAGSYKLAHMVRDALDMLQHVAAAHLRACRAHAG